MVKSRIETLRPPEISVQHIFPTKSQEDNRQEDDEKAITDVGDEIPRNAQGQHARHGGRDSRSVLWLMRT